MASAEEILILLKRSLETNSLTESDIEEIEDIGGALQRLDGRELQRVRSLAHENARLARSCVHGIASAIELLNGTSGVLDTHIYDQFGSSRSVTGKSSSIQIKV